MNYDERIKLVKAMEYIARQINDEEVFLGWIELGVADGDIKYGDLSADDPDCDRNGYYDWYIEDDNFAELMGHFIRMMSLANKSGGLYCDNVVSK